MSSMAEAFKNAKINPNDFENIEINEEEIKQNSEIDFLERWLKMLARNASDKEKYNFIIKHGFLSVKHFNLYMLCKDEADKLEYEKEVSVEIHAIQEVEKLLVSEEEKDKLRLNSARKIGKTRIKKVNCQRQMRITDTFMEAKGFDNEQISDFIKRIDFTLTNYEKILNKKYDLLTEEKVEELQIMKKIPYRTEKERLRLIQKWNKVYANVTFDNKDKVVICYNRANGKDARQLRQLKKAL